MSIFDDIVESVENIYKELITKYNHSNRWKEYHLGTVSRHCINCFERCYKIYEVGNEPCLPEHERCACYLKFLRSVNVGSATKLGFNGADYFIKHFGELPNYYITKEEAIELGWISWKGNLDEVAPNKMIGGNIYLDREGKLPSREGRIWYECDIDYQGGFRNNYRLIYSNDGLIFKTDNHYQRFIAVE